MRDTDRPAACLCSILVRKMSYSADSGVVCKVCLRIQGVYVRDCPKVICGVRPENVVFLLKPHSTASSHKKILTQDLDFISAFFCEIYK